MALIREIEKKIYKVEYELKWLNERIEESENDWINEDEVNWDSVKSGFDDVESSFDNLKGNVMELVDILKDLI